MQVQRGYLETNMDIYVLQVNTHAHIDQQMQEYVILFCHFY